MENGKGLNKKKIRLCGQPKQYFFLVLVGEVGCPLDPISARGLTHTALTSMIGGYARCSYLNANFT